MDGSQDMFWSTGTYVAYVTLDAILLKFDHLLYFDRTTRVTVFGYSHESATVTRPYALHLGVIRRGT